LLFQHLDAEPVVGCDIISRSRGPLHPTEAAKYRGRQSLSRYQLLKTFPEAIETRVQQDLVRLHLFKPRLSAR
jgi:hypothetical protein